MAIVCQDYTVGIHVKSMKKWFLHDPDNFHFALFLTLQLEPASEMLFLIRHILSVNEKLPPLKFRYFENYIISFKTFSLNHDSVQSRIDSLTLNRSSSPGTIEHVLHVQCDF